VPGSFIFAAQSDKMKKTFLAAFVFFAVAASAQKTKTASKPVPKKTASPASSVLKSQTDSVSYAIGLNVAKFYQEQGIKSLNSAMVAKAVSDWYAKKQMLLNEQQCQDVMICHLKPELCERIEEGKKFMAVHKSKAGVKTTASGIQYEILTPGSGEKPRATDTVTVNYAGTLLNGTEFDNSYKRGAPATFPLNAVIPGWTEALQLMPIGSKYRIYIPQNLGYGMNDQGPIPGGSVLVFEVELLSIQKAQ
jgi:FKBP-type peptidyl-prolyl cis-trans isomerase